jgi:nicotinate-nucleotide adenylyltransferase
MKFSRHRKVGLLGGSFNPAHAGHVHLSLTALKQLRLDEVWWLVSPQNPLKAKGELADYETRLKHARLITAAHAPIKVSDIERTLGARYSFDTVRALQKRYRNIRFVWLMGADNLAQFHRWRRWAELFKLLPVVVFDRAPFSHYSLRTRTSLRFFYARLKRDKIQRVALQHAPAWAYIFMAKHPASATEIRKSLGKKAFLEHNEIG